MNDYFEPTPLIIAHMKLAETYAREAYADKGGGLAVGYGHSNAPGTPPVVDQSTVIETEPEAEAVLITDMKVFARSVRHYLKIAVSEQSFWALVSLCFNIGQGNFKKSQVLAFINDPTITYHMVKAKTAFLEHAKAEDPLTGESRVYLGLMSRRIDEAAMFLPIGQR